MVGVQNFEVVPERFEEVKICTSGIYAQKFITNLHKY
jgi:hypothetical protein